MVSRQEHNYIFNTLYTCDNAVSILYKQNFHAYRANIYHAYFIKNVDSALEMNKELHLST